MAISRAVGSSSVSRDGQTWAVIDSGGGGEMLLTPGAGTYLAVFSATMYGTRWNTTKETVDIAIFGNGTIVSHSVRRFAHEDSWTANDRWIMETHAIVTVGAGEDIDVRWQTSTAGQTAFCLNRELTITPVSTYIEKYSTTPISTATTDWSATLLTLDSNPSADTYVLLFSTSAYTNTGNPERIGIRYYQGGSFTGWEHTYREAALEDSFADSDMPIALYCMIDPDGSESVTIRWASVGSGPGLTINANERCMILVVPDSYGETVNANASTGITNTTWALIGGTPSMSISGLAAGQWFGLFSMSTDWSVGEDDQHADYAFYEGSTRNANTDRRNSNDGSLSQGWVPVTLTGMVELETSENLEVWWQSTSSTSRDATERGMLAFQVAGGPAAFDGMLGWRED